MIRKSDDPILSQDQIEYKCCSRCGDTRPTHWFGFCRRDNKPKNPCKPCLAKDRDALIARLTAKDTGQKYCVGCKKVLPLGNFWRDRSKADGRNTNCQDCRSQDDYQRDRRRRIRAARAIAPRDGYKVCHKCVEELPESWFAINNKKTGKLETICRVCNSRVPELMRNKLLAARDNKRWCNKCETAKDDSEFSAPYTNGAYCLNCKQVSNREWREKYPERYAEFRRRQVEKYVPKPRPEPTKEELEEREERERERGRKWKIADRQKNPEKYRQASRRWRKNNPERVKARDAAGQHNRRTKKARNGGKVTTSEIVELHTSQGGLCFYCKCKLDGEYHIDHMTPVSRGGSSDIGNLCCSCPECNHQKTTKTVKEYIAWLAEKATFCTLNERENAVLSNFK